MARLSFSWSVLFLGGCVLSPIDPAGRACDELDRCAEGWTCDIPSRTCVRSEVDAAGIDAAGIDAGADAPIDLDAPPFDAFGMDIGDAAAPICTPACDPQLERCTAAGCELVPYTPGALTTHRPLVVERLGLSFTDATDIEIDFRAIGAINGTPLEDIDVVIVPARTDVPGEPYRVCRFYPPDRPADRPFVLATEGGTRCEIGHVEGGNNWILTGRHDESQGIGSASFPGHDGGYASSRGRYGWEFLGVLDVSLDGTVPTPAFVVEYVEVSGQIDVFGLDGIGVGGPVPYRGVIRESYVHDVRKNGISAGSDAPAGARVALIRNRVVRTGMNCVNLVGVGDGTLVRNNVLAGCRTAALADVDFYQGDFGMFVVAPTGTIRIERNVIAGTEGTPLGLRDGGLAPMPRPHFSVSRLLVDGGRRAHVSFAWDVIGATGDDFDALLTVRETWFNDVTWDWAGMSIDEAGPPALISVPDNGRSTIELSDVRWDPTGFGERALPLAHDDATAVRCGSADVAPAAFVDYLGGPAVTFIETWSAGQCRPDDIDGDGDDGTCPTPAPRAFGLDDLVTNRGVVYRASRATTAGDVPGTSSAWALVSPQPADDLRLVPASAYAAAGIGL